MPAGAVPFPFGDCRVCNDHATGVHYGVATCEGCKGFFKRSTMREEKYKCFFGGACVLTPQNRSRCKACRFQMCLKQGMAIDAVKMGRIPKLEKEKALRDFHSNQSSASKGPGVDYNTPQQIDHYSSTNPPTQLSQTTPSQTLPTPSQHTQTLFTPSQHTQTLPTPSQHTQGLPTPSQHTPSVPTLHQFPTKLSEPHFGSSFSRPFQQNTFGTYSAPSHQNTTFPSKFDNQENKNSSNPASLEKDRYGEEIIHPNYFLELDKDPTAEQDYFASLDKDHSELWRSNGKTASNTHKDACMKHTVFMDYKNDSRTEKCQLYDDHQFSDMGDKARFNPVKQSNWNLEETTKTTKTNCHTRNEMLSALGNETGRVGAALDTVPYSKQEGFVRMNSSLPHDRFQQMGIETDLTPREADIKQHSDSVSELEQHIQRGVFFDEKAMQDTRSEEENSTDTSQVCRRKDIISQSEKDSRADSQDSTPTSEKCPKLHDQSATISNGDKVDNRQLQQMDTKGEKMSASYDNSDKVDTSGRLLDAEKLNLVESTIDRLKVAIDILYAPLKKKRATIQDYFDKKVTMKFTDLDNIPEVWKMLVGSLETVNQRSFAFCSKVPGFSNLEEADRKKLMLRAYLDIWMVSSSEFFIDEESYLIIADGVFYSRATMTELMNTNIVNKMFLFARKLNKLRLSDFELGALCAVQLLTGDDLELENRVTVEELHSHYLDVFIHTISLNHPTTSSRLLVDVFRLFPLLAEINQINTSILANARMNRPTTST